jgi:hypothetical protein
MNPRVDHLEYWSKNAFLFQIFSNIKIIGIMHFLNNWLKLKNYHLKIKDK